MKLETLSLVAIVLTAISASIAIPNDANAQGGDAVYLVQTDGSRSSSRVTGNITSMSRENVVINSRNADKDIPAEQIRYISFAGEPSQLERARERLEDQRYADCLTELGKITEESNSPLIAQQVAFLDAYATAKLALRGESGTANEAGSKINSFVKKFGDSIHFYPATEMLGELYMAIGKADLAEGEFAKLASASWPEYKVKGLYLQGQSQLMLDKIEDAKTTFSAIQALTATDDLTQEHKVIAKCQLARIATLQGDASAQQVITDIIKTENSETRKLLFANAYNALGAIHQKQNQLKDAAQAYLHTELLFATESGPHSEALFHLTQIWQKLGETDRAARARSKLQSRYRNSFWASKL